MNEKPKIDLEQLKRGGMVKLKEKDMFSVWVRAICCNMDAKKLSKVADIAEKFGRGIVLFTTRQFPIIPHVHFNNIQPALDALKEVQLMTDRCGARVRNADVCYDSSICPFAITNPISLGEKIDEFWQKDPGGHKIKISIVGCSKQCTSPRVLSDLGFVGVAEGRYDAYVGGRLGLKPLVGVKIAENLSEEECVKFIHNFFALLRKEGKYEERSADLVNRLGAETLKKELNRDLNQSVDYKAYVCDTKLDKKIEGKIIRIKLICGEATSVQTRKIAAVAEKYGLGFVHFAVRGTAEIPGVKEDKVDAIKKELAAADLEILEKGVDNLQSCFGDYCTNGIVDAHALLKKIDKLVEELKINDLDIKISAAGCPNTCAISPISDIGLWGVIEPKVDDNICSGCEICVKSCKVNAIAIKDGKAVIDFNKCKWCMDCINACPVGAIIGGKKGYALSIEGRGGYFPYDKRGEETKLGKVIANFISEEEALKLTKEILLKIKRGEEI